ncbi:HVO_0758 family zinc finger protein [Halobaculum lipolyticum]|uniref:HVO_0758 family zinc finger protein n=1 Tax=Halobaculum lipolyticum TaxID=3032001 RepID=A0ABD5W4Z4_9EURY|nr:HVO_0758 family zinc finger protein [Halobaculum sp. DT31]
MKSTRKGLREGELEKDNYERLSCAECGENLGKENPPDEVFSVRTCPNCGREWKELR